jgi:hypothetical protein
VPAVLSVCDGLLGEIGRRDHLFSWLRAPDSEHGQWLPVTAYYPGKRLVLACDLESSPHKLIYEELIPAHGLRLLPVTVDELPPDRDLARALLEVRIAALGPDPTPPREMEPREPVERARPVATAVASLVRPSPAPAAPPQPPQPPQPPASSQAAAMQRAARLLAARRAEAGDTWSAASDPQPKSARRTRRDWGGSQAAVLQPPSILLGLVLAAVVCLEMYVAVAGIALSDGQLLLAIAFALDACARALGAIAAGKVDRHDWAWGCVIVGSPVVAGFALFQRTGPVMTEPAPLAGLVSLAAMGLVAVALLAWIVGI